MKIGEYVASEDLFCARCLDLGIETPAILKSSRFFLLENDIVLPCCEDCLIRLQDEIEQNGESSV